jgi:integrase
MAVSATRPYRVRKRPPAAQGEVTFGVYAERWFGQQRVLADAGLLRISTLYRCESALRAHLLPFFAARPLASITREQCDGFRIAAVNVGRLKPSTVNAIFQILRQVLRAAHRDGLIDRDPVSGTRSFRVAPRLVRPYDRAEVDMLLAAVGPQGRAVVGLAALAGLRQGEAFALARADVDFDERCILVRRSVQRHHHRFSTEQRLAPPKTTTGYRHVPLQASLASVIKQHLAESWKPNRYDLLCPGRNGEPHVAIQFHRHVFMPAITGAGLRRTRFHDLRRCFVAQCVAAGIPAAQTAAWLGHSLRMTTLYYQVGHTERMAALGLLDRLDGGG